jgi:hypothetical protein
MDNETVCDENRRSGMRKLNGMTFLAMAMIGCALAGQARAQQNEGLLQKRLDTPVTVRIEDKPITELFHRLARETAVRFSVSEQTLAALPYGDKTHMDVQLRGITLRAALPQMLKPHGLDWRLIDGTIEIVPSAPLNRMCRRATFDEIVLLGRLLTTPVSTETGEDDPRSILRKASGDDDLTLVLPEELLGKGLDKARRQADQILPAPAAEWLDMLCGKDHTWYLSGDRITVLARPDQVRRQLQRRVSLRYQDTQLVKVLLDLARQADIKLTLAPGSLSALPKDVRTDFTLMIDDATIAQAFEVISGASGLEFSVTAEGVDARPALDLAVGGATATPNVGVESPEPSAAERRRRARVILRTSFIGSDGVERDVLLPMFDLPDDVVETIERQRAQAIVEMQKHWVLPAPEPDPSKADGSK